MEEPSLDLTGDYGKEILSYYLWGTKNHTRYECLRNR